MKRAAKNVAERASGTTRLQEEIDTLYYFLNSYMDIRKLPKATGALRELQVCDAAMLRVFDALCRKQRLEYWLDYGTLLGAARHGGFIPWDDDLDVSMERIQWNRAADTIPPILEKMGFYVRVYSESWFGFGYKRDKTGLWMDVFCYEVYKDEGEADLSPLHAQIDEQLQFCRKHRTFDVAPRITREEMRSVRDNTLYSENAQRSGSCHLFLSPEIQDNLSHKIYDYKDIFPLEQLEYEGAMLPVPRNWDKVLKESYGNYLEFPRTGVLHHGIEGTSLKDLAELNCVDMGIIRSDLEKMVYGITEGRQ